MHTPLNPTRVPRFRPVLHGPMLVLWLASLSGCETAPAPTEPLPPRAADFRSARCTWPQALQPAIVGGTTRLQYTVGPTGQVSRVKVVQSSGDTAEHKRLDRLAFNYVSSCVWPSSPGTAPAQQTTSIDWVLN